MSSRQEEKEQRKRERLEREAAEKKAAQRKRLVQILGGVVIAAAVIVGVVLAGTGGGGDDDRDAGDLTAAAKKAGCTVKNFPDYGSTHVPKKLTAKDFKTNPPTSGDHNVTPAQDGVYAPDNEPEIQNWVHTLEHGRIIFMYRKGTAKGRIAQLQNLFNEESQGKSGYHSVLMQNNSEMPFEVTAVAWRRYIACPTFTDGALPAMRAFRDVYVDTAPEQIP
ncbi:MAG: DUF3105 domain-containing protein [Solirubrobacterales bacterium]|nr:DUF3105 domain-containing protein [Solirubrobacterales bacterium]